MAAYTCVICNGPFDAIAKRSYCSYPCRYAARIARPRYITYNSWKCMRSRCTRRTDVEYGRYGGSGIKICDRWMVFDNFLADMGFRPSREFSLDRIDGKGNYEPANCRWADKETQVSNMSSNRLITCRGETLTASQWARRLGVRVTVIYGRLAYGWSPEDAVTMPSIPKSAKRPKPFGTGKIIAQ